MGRVAPPPQPSALEGREGRKRRWRPAVDQKEVLDSVYAQTSVPVPDKVESLAALLQVTQRQVRIWFQNRRQRSKDKPKLPAIGDAASGSALAAPVKVRVPRVKGTRPRAVARRPRLIKASDPPPSFTLERPVKRAKPMSLSVALIPAESLLVIPMSALSPTSCYLAQQVRPSLSPVLDQWASSSPKIDASAASGRSSLQAAQSGCAEHDGAQAAHAVPPAPACSADGCGISSHVVARDVMSARVTPTPIEAQAASEPTWDTVDVNEFLKLLCTEKPN